MQYDYLYFDMCEVCLWVVQCRCNRFCVTFLQDFMSIIAFTIMRDMPQVGMLHCRYVFFIQEKLIYYFYFKMYRCVCWLWHGDDVTDLYFTTFHMLTQ